MKPTNLFVMNLKTGDYLRVPDTFKPSACTPLFLAAYKKRESGACIHTHSQAAVMVSLLYDKEFRIANIEQIKALPKVTEPGNLGFFDTLVIPIIENTAHEDELLPDMEKVMDEYPGCSAVIVRRHGLYVWGPTVWKAKIYNEAIDYLLELAIKMKQAGISPDGAIGSEVASRKI